MIFLYIWFLFGFITMIYLIYDDYNLGHDIKLSDVMYYLFWMMIGLYGSYVILKESDIKDPVLIKGKEDKNE